MKPEGQRVKQEAGKLRTQAAQGESPAKPVKHWTTWDHLGPLPRPRTHTHTQPHSILRRLPQYCSGICSSELKRYAYFSSKQAVYEQLPLSN